MAHERRQISDSDQAIKGIAMRYLRARVPVSELKMREADAPNIEELVWKKLCEMACNTREKAAAELQPLAPESIPVGAAAELQPLAPEPTPVEAAAEVKKELSLEQKHELLKTVQARFEANMNRHEGIEWSQVKAKLEASPEKMWALNNMAEPDVVGRDKKTGEYIFFELPEEIPEDHRNIVYNKGIENYLKKNYPNEKCNGNAVDMAKAMGIEMLDESEYKQLQTLGKFDKNIWIWVKTPADKAISGDALRGNCDGVCLYVNMPYANFRAHGAFRGSLRV